MNNNDKNIFIHPTAIVDEPCQIGAGTKIWHFCHVMSEATLGEKCNLGLNVFIGKHVALGNGVKIQNNVSVYEGVILKDNVFVGPSAVFTNVINPRAFIERKNEYKNTVVESGVSIGANATIVCGVTLGAYCFIGAGCVVIHDVPAHAVMVGNPARQIGWMSKAGLKLAFGEQLIATCPTSGERYELKNNSISII